MSTRYSYIEYTGDGSQTDFPIDFPYIKETHIQATVDGSPVEITWASDSVVRVSPAPANGTRVFIRRLTDGGPLVVFTDGPTLRAHDLNLSATQSLYIAQEAVDQAFFGVVFDSVLGGYDFAGRRASNLADPVDDADAATQGWVTDQYNSGVDAGAAQLAAEAAEAAAEAAQTAAEAAQTNADGHRIAAEAAKVAAEAAQLAAETAETNSSAARDAALAAQTAAEAAQTSAESASTDAQNALSDFETNWLGALAADPVSAGLGALYYNTAVSEYRVCTDAVGPVFESINGEDGQDGADGAQGPAGADGADGQDGEDGTKWLAGSGAPSAGVGLDGDFYIDTAAHAYYGPKAAGAWSSGPYSLQGPQGEQGPQGPQGDPGPAGTDGQNGVDGVDGMNGQDGEDGTDGAFIGTEPIVTSVDSQDLLPVQLNSDGTVRRVRVTNLGVGGGSSLDASLLYLYLADHLSVALNMVKGVADPLADEDNLDGANCYNQIFDGPSKLYMPDLETVSHIPLMTGVITSGVTMSASSEGISRQAWRSADQDTGTAWRTNGTSVGWVQVNFGASREVHSYSVQAADIIGQAPKDWIFEGSNNGTDWTTLDTRSSETSWGVSEIRNYLLPALSNYSYYRLNITDNNGEALTCIAEFGVYPVPEEGMILISEAFEASTIPDTASIGVQLVENEPTTVNTDITVNVSRDGGVTWTQATLEFVAEFPDGEKYYEHRDLDISGQPSGQSLKYRIQTYNGKDIYVSGVVLKWK